MHSTLDYSFDPTRSLRLRLGIIFALFSAAVALALTGLLGQLGRQETEREMRNHLTHSAQELARAIDVGLDERVAEIQLIGQLLRGGAANDSDERRLLEEFQRSNGRYVWIGVVGLNGTVRSATGGVLEGESFDSESIFRRDLSGPHIGNVHPASILNSSKAAIPPDVLDAGMPLTDSAGHPTAALCAFINWEWLQRRYEDLARPLRESRQAEVLLIDERGRVLFAPRGSGLEGQIFSRDELTDPRRHDGQFLYGAAESRELHEFVGPGWQVIVRQPAEVAFAQVQRLQWQLILGGLVGALLAGIGGYCVSGHFTKPVVQLAHVAREIAEGKTSSTLPDAPHEDEIGALTSALRSLLETRERQAHELRQSFRQFTGTFENAGVGISQVSIDSRWLRVNQKLAEITGYRPEELRGRNIADLTHPDDLEADLANSDRLLRGEASAFTMEKRYIRKDGAIVWINLSVSLVRDDAGKPDYFIAVAEDITARRNAEAALRESEIRFREMADHTPVLIWTCDTAMRRTFVNRPWLDFTGKTAEEELASSWCEGVHPEDFEACSGEFERAFAAREKFRTEYRLRRHDQEYRWILMQGVPLYRDDVFVGYVGSGADITENRQAAEDQRAGREAAEAASRAKDEFLAALSHELRTPLNPVLLLASENERALDLSPQLRDDFAAIHKNIALEARLIDDLLDLTRITRGKLQLHFVPTDLHAVLHQALGLVRSDLEAKQLIISLDLSAPEHQVLGDAVRLQQVFWNIILNAVKFTPPGGRIDVRTRVGAGRTLQVLVCDSGLGIAPDEMPRIFETFGQGEHSATHPHRFGGLGLGLAIARLLVEKHEGRIWAESDGTGQGATFHVELPLCECTAAPEPLSLTPTIPKQTHRRILLVEDHEPTRATLLRILQRHGHQVAVAETTAVARALAATNEFDLVISDLGLPDGTGHELMSDLRASHNLPGIALSGYGMEEDVQRSHDCGFHAHLTKPVDITALEAAISEAPWQTLTETPSVQEAQMRPGASRGFLDGMDVMPVNRAT